MEYINSWKLGILDINLNNEKEKKDYFNRYQLLVRKKCYQCHKLLSTDKFIPYKWNICFIEQQINVNNICSCCQKINLEEENRDFVPKKKDLNKRKKLAIEIHNYVYFNNLNKKI